MQHLEKPRWSYKKLNDLGFVGRGKSRHRPRNEPSLYGGIYPFVQTGDVKSTDLYITNYSQTYNDKGLAQSKLWQQGTLLITIAANIAETAILAIEACFPDSIVGFIADPNKADVRFVKYYIDFIKLQMQNISRGTTQDNLSVDKLLTFDFFIPEVGEQRRIAAILSAYDDMIENNAQRIKALEQSAHDLYREWFVEFRFPGHESVPLVDSGTEYGMIPQGWGVVRLEDCCHLIMGQSPKSELYNEDGLGLPFHQGVGTFGERFPTTQRWTTAIGRVANTGDILFSVRAPVGRINIADTQLIIGRGLSAIRSKLNCQIFIFEQLQIIFHEEDLIGSGTIFHSVTKTDMENIQMIKPDLFSMVEFENIAYPISEEIRVLSEKNKTLREARDLLLPRLVSGQVDVSEIEVEIGSEA